MNIFVDGYLILRQEIWGDPTERPDLVDTTFQASL